jgi:hypothetical protein
MEKGGFRRWHLEYNTFTPNGSFNNSPPAPETCTIEEHKWQNPDFECGIGIRGRSLTPNGLAGIFNIP